MYGELVECRQFIVLKVNEVIYQKDSYRYILKAGIYAMKDCWPSIVAQ